MSTIDPLSDPAQGAREDGWRHGKEPSLLSEALWILGIFAGAFVLVALLAAF